MNKKWKTIERKSGEERKDVRIEKTIKSEKKIERKMTEGKKRKRIK